jgi:hypothetical protein
MQTTRLMFADGTGARGVGAREGERDGMGVDGNILEPQTGEVWAVGLWAASSIYIMF